MHYRTISVGISDDKGNAFIVVLYIQNIYLGSSALLRTIKVMCAKVVANQLLMQSSAAV